ncbi:UNVERIFIED_CONTAM: Homogentisate 1,2-dioxygenase [Sesamum angustifolium]|uniref:Homogentisate 1,2-dioxygenase n=1 Tax=Sesamum angustifolium TaxID=2727405 RepID=A0AAW2PD78_9LAMI
MESKSAATRPAFPAELEYQSGFGNHFSSEAIAGALPLGQNSPLACPYGLYAEQISGTSFTSPRKFNQRSWLYRVKPSVTHEPFKPRVPSHGKLVSEFNESNSSATRLSCGGGLWKCRNRQLISSTDCIPYVARAVRIFGMVLQFTWSRPKLINHGQGHFASYFLLDAFGNGSYGTKVIGKDGDGLTDASLIIVLTHVLFEKLKCQFKCRYTANKSMDDCAFCSADGDFLIVPQEGSANGLAASRDFLVPVAWFEQLPRPGYTIVQKFGGELFTAKQDFSPFNVVAWHGNYVPYKFDLSKFCPYNTVLVDHGDPSINTVLTAPTERPGVALLDFVIFPPRWLVAEHTFRPPYYHRNCMSEFMGLIHGGYEAKADGFLPGGASLHSCMTPHGPDTKTFEATIALGNEAGPRRISNTMAFMFESCLMPRVCPWALESPYMDHNYYQCWIGLKSHFTYESVSEDGQDVGNGHGGNK